MRVLKCLSHCSKRPIVYSTLLEVETSISAPRGLPCAATYASKGSRIQSSATHSRRLECQQWAAARSRLPVVGRIQCTENRTPPWLARGTTKGPWHERSAHKNARPHLGEASRTGAQAVYSLDCSRRHVSMESAKYCTLFSFSPAMEMRPDFSRYTWNSFVRRTQTGSGRPV